METITIQANSTPQGVIIALHGWGANAEDLAELAPILNLPNYTKLFVQAPFDHPNVYGGRMWYDFQNPNSNQLAESRSQLKTYIASIVTSESFSHLPVFLLGFSQGGAMTLDVGLELKLAGLISLSGYLHSDIANNAIATPIFTPILIVHGVRDAVVPVIAAQSAKTTLTKLGAKVSYHEFDMGHEINLEAIATVRNFILENSPEITTENTAKIP
ncbi:putative esterase [Synechococcus sp. PCC 7502]|uniref:alpha/beta hydrolase n=1 Tax=Synechococcus sp. PCC 7502 TaxID=1173263 RepID=UPI00029FF269|nr:dienelactone hydrolase family protein [Synechococcus sp. PCC 7502]AFY72317.1 putative esterase [Synechococcus sp. PCC 7502]